MKSNPSDPSFPIQPPPQCKICIDTVLSSIAFRYRDAVDPLLDLKLDTARKTNPGQCVQTYFWLLNHLPATAREELHQIRLWIEGLIEIWAFKRNRELFSRRSVVLNSDSLEEYCRAVMEQFRRLTAHSPCDLELQFAFRNSGL